MRGGIVERDQRASLLIVEIVPGRPGNLVRRRNGAVPLHRCRAWRDGTLLGFRAAVAERFVAASDAVVVHGYRIEIKMRESLAKIPRRDTGHAHRGHRLDLVHAHWRNSVYVMGSIFGL